MYKNRNLTPHERSLLLDVFDRFLSCDWCAWKGNPEVEDLAAAITATRHVTLEYDQV